MDQDERVRYEAELEEVLGYLDHPPAPESAEGRRFADLLQRVESLAVGAGLPDELPEEPTPVGPDAATRARLDSLRRRSQPVERPHFVTGDGLGPTLGMHLKGA